MNHSRASEMRLTPIERYLLDIGTEDYSWIADATVAHRQADPALTQEEAVLRAQKTVRRLLEANAISLHWDDIGNSTESHRATRALTASETAAVFPSLDPWIPGRRSPDAGVAFTTTESGERLLHEAA